jgi:hypothetical protein
MKSFQSLLLLLITFSLHAQSITFGPTSTLFNLDGAHWPLSQPMIPASHADGKHQDFYGLTGSTYKRHTYTNGSYPATPLVLFGAFNFITDVRDFDGDGKYDILTDADLFKQTTSSTFERQSFGNISYEVEGSLDYNGDGRRDVVITEDDFVSGNTSLYIFKNNGNFSFDKVVVEQNKRKFSTVIVGDVNQDGRDDIITANSGDFKPFTVFLSNPDGSFTTRDLLGNDHYFLSQSYSVADLDKDGDLDLMALDNQKGLWIFENKDGFVTTSQRQATSFDAVTDALSVHSADLNNDGWTEIIVCTLTASQLNVLVSKGTGPFVFDIPKKIGTMLGGTSDFAPAGRAVTRLLHTVDINADGKKDIVMTSTFDKKQVAWLNTSLISAVEDEELTNTLIFPIPTSSILKISSEKVLTYKIIDMMGRLMQSGTVMDDNSIEVRSLNPGNYILLLSNEKGSVIPRQFSKI